MAQPGRKVADFPSNIFNTWYVSSVCFFQFSTSEWQTLGLCRRMIDGDQQHIVSIRLFPFHVPTAFAKPFEHTFDDQVQWNRQQARSNRLDFQCQLIVARDAGLDVQTDDALPVAALITETNLYDVR